MSDKIAEIMASKVNKQRAEIERVRAENKRVRAEMIRVSEENRRLREDTGDLRAVVAQLQVDLSSRVMGNEVERVRQVEANPSLLPCPFCNGGETVVEERWAPPLMERPRSLEKVWIRHWCDIRAARPAQRLYVEVQGRCHADAAEAWNMRSKEGKP